MPSQGRPFDQALKKISQSKFFGKKGTKLALEASKEFEKRRVETPKSSKAVQENMKTREREMGKQRALSGESGMFAGLVNPVKAQWKHPKSAWNEKTGLWESSQIKSGPR